MNLAIDGSPRLAPKRTSQSSPTMTTPGQRRKRTSVGAPVEAELKDVDRSLMGSSEPKQEVHPCPESRGAGNFRSTPGESRNYFRWRSTEPLSERVMRRVLELLGIAAN